MCSIMGFSRQIMTEEEIREYFDRTKSRGPDMSRIEKAGEGCLCFHRLAIMGLDETGMQPFHLNRDMCVCNGELYLFRPLKKKLEDTGYTFLSGSDCEIILPLYREYGLGMFAMLDAEFAMILYDGETDEFPSASVRCSTDTTQAAASSLPARRKTLWGFARRFSRSLRDITTLAAALSAMRI